METTGYIRKQEAEIRLRKYLKDTEQLGKEQLMMQNIPAIY